MEFQALPVLETGRIKLGPFRYADAADVYAYARNPNVPRFMPWTTHIKLEDARAYIKRVMARHEGDYCWAIRIKREMNEEGAATATTGRLKVIGAIELDVQKESEAEVHFVLAEEWWNKGLTTEAVRTVVTWGFAQYPALERVISRAVEDNAGSRRVMEKCGMTLQGTQREKWDKYPEAVELCVYAVTRAEWCGG